MCVQQSVFFLNSFLIKSKWLCYLFVREVKEIWLALRAVGAQDAAAQSYLWEKEKCNLCPGVGRRSGWVRRVKRWGVLKRSCDKGLLMQTVNSGRRGWDFIFASFTACIQILCCKCKCRKKLQLNSTCCHQSHSLLTLRLLLLSTPDLKQEGCGSNACGRLGRACLHICCLHSFNVQLRTTLRNANISHTCILKGE